MAVSGMSGLVAVGPPGTTVYVGPELVGEGETSRDGVVVCSGSGVPVVDCTGSGVPVIGGGILVGGWGVIEGTSAK